MKNTSRKKYFTVIKGKKSLSMAEWEKLVKKIHALNIKIPGNNAVKFIHKNR